MPPKAGGDDVPSWWDPQWAARNVEYKLVVTATFHPSAGTASLSLPWLDATGQVTAALQTSGPLSGFEVDETKTGPNKRFPGAVTASLEKSLGSLPVSYQFIQGLQKASLPITVELGTGDPNAKSGGVARIHPGALLLSNDVNTTGDEEELVEKLPYRPCEVSASLTETVGFAGIYKLDVKITTDIPVLSTEMLRKLMPACISVDVVRGLPNELWLASECEDVHVEVRPQVGANTKKIAEEYHRSVSIKRPHNTFVKFSEPTVWLLGIVPVHTVREWIQSEAVVVEVHDRILKRKEEPPIITDDMDEETREAAERKRKRIEDRVFPHGLARFKLSPLLASKTLTSGLRAEIFPNRGNNKKLRAETQKPLKPVELLGEDGREIIADIDAIGKTEVTPEYVASGAICTIKVTLSVPLPPAKHIQSKEEEVDGEEYASKEQRDGESNIWMCDSPKKDAEPAKKGGKGASPVASPVKPDAKAAPAKRCRAKITANDEEQTVIHGPWRASREEAEVDEQHLLSVLEENPEEMHHVHKASETLKSKNSLGVDRRYERYGRVVIIADDNDTKTNKAVINCVKLHNAEVLGIGPESVEMVTRSFYDEERDNPHLDVLTGFSVLDGKCRLMVVEGLREHGLQKLLQAVPRDAQPNSVNFKMLHNPAIGFSERQYLDFGPNLYQLKIRIPLEKLAAKPDLYITMGKINEEQLVGMKVPAILMQIKKMERLQPLREGTTFPKAAHVEQLNILFGDYLSDGMMEGESVALELERDAAMPMRQTSKRTMMMKSQLETVTQLSKTQPNLHGRTLLPHSTLQLSQNKRDIMTKTQSVTQWPQGQTMRTQQALRDLPVACGSVPEVRPQLDHWNKSYAKTLSMRKTTSEPDMHTRNVQRVQERSDANVHLNHIMNKRQPRQTPFLDGEEVYLYSGQKHNCVEKQKAWMRETMSTQEQHTMYSYAPNYLSGTFEISEEGAESGKRVHQAKCASDTYARLPGDTRAVWRNPPARPKEDFRKTHDNKISPARVEELNEQFVDGEWFKLPVGDARHKPTVVHHRWEPDKIPHHRRITERPFDRAQITVLGQEFGPPSMNESVHYNAHGAPGYDRHDDVVRNNVTKRDEETNKIMHDLPFMKTFSQGQTRRGITCTDREEMILKDAPAKVWRGSGVDDKLPTSLRIFEPFHEHGNPSNDFQARMRENDSSAPFDVRFGGYTKRDPEIGMKSAFLSGTVNRAPWRHEAAAHPAKPTRFEYVSNNDFDATRMPGKSIHDESHVWKNASRTMIQTAERSGHQNYSRPKGYAKTVTQGMTRSLGKIPMGTVN